MKYFLLLYYYFFFFFIYLLIVIIINEIKNYKTLIYYEIYLKN